MYGCSKKQVFFKTDLQKKCLLGNCEDRNWRLTTDGYWNVYWGTVGSIRKIFNLDSGIRLRDDQMVNHFPNHFELTRKDLMVKNIKRYRKTLERNGDAIAERSADGSYVHLDFVPSTYLLPADYPLFEEEFKRRPNEKWILKPTARAQGAGIFIVNKLSQVKKWAVSRWDFKDEPYVISHYVERPLLVGGKKFDLRLFVLVTSFRPLKAYCYKLGFARFSNVKYTTDKDQMNNAEIHLTNVAIQKHGVDYNAAHGNKWSLQNFRAYIGGVFGQRALQQLSAETDSILLHSLLAVQSTILNDKHCFECYGYDLLVDSKLKPWLIEVNASPSLSATTKADRDLKRKLIRDLYKVVVPTDFPSANTSQGNTHWNSQPKVGDFQLLYDESSHYKADSKQKEKANSAETRSRTWK